MKKSKKTHKLLAALLGLTLFLGGAASAKDGQCKRDGNCSNKVERMSQKLDLNEQQEAQFLAIFESYKPTMKSLREQMKGTFTEAQQEAMKAHRQANKGQRGKLNKEDREAHFDSLGVSEGQRQQLKSLKEQLREQRKSQRAELMAALNSDQQETFKEMRGRRGHKRGHRGQNS